MDLFINQFSKLLFSIFISYHFPLSITELAPGCQWSCCRNGNVPRALQCRKPDPTSSRTLLTYMYMYTGRSIILLGGIGSCQVVNTSQGPISNYNLFQRPWDFWQKFRSIYWMKWETRFSTLNLIIRLIFPVGKKGQLGKKILFYVL